MKNINCKCETHKESYTICLSCQEIEVQEQEAKKQCKLAVKESIDDNPSKVRHAPFSYEIYEAVDCKT